MCGTEQPREELLRGDSGSNHMAVNQFLIFFLEDSTLIQNQRKKNER